MVSVFIAAVSLQQGALSRGLLTDVHSQPGTHRPVRTHEHTHRYEKWKKYWHLYIAHTGEDNLKNTHLDLSALKSLIPSAGPQI